MGDEVSRGPAMRRVSWWSVDMVSRLLEADERDAVRGDLTESGASGERALRDVLGLVMRRQAVVIVHPGNYRPLTAFDANTGDVKWTAGGDGFFASPIVVTLGGTRQVVSVTQKNVIGVSVADGGLLWEYPWPGGVGGTMPVLYEETIIVSGLNVGVTAFRPARRDGKWVAETVWQTKDVSMYLSNPVVIGGALFGLSHRASGQFFALDARTGKTLWLGQPREATNTAVVKAGDLLFLLNDDAELIVAKSGRTGFQPLRRYRVADSATWAQPAISGNRLFIKDVSSLALWALNQPRDSAP
ncbi:MAG: PQQ-binding-like beta-propeller repeat protein [Luteitalea sp.]|nr:PQQ-binding-like beta-propeller repeat protein [Luteitalea sp.]